MKKRLFISIFCVFSYCISFGQDSTVTVVTGPRSNRPLEVVLIVNGFLVADATYANLFLSKLSSVISKRNAFGKADGYKKWGIDSKDGLLFCTTKGNIVIDFEKMEIIKKHD